jgi:hypothetical protein
VSSSLHIPGQGCMPGVPVRRAFGKRLLSSRSGGAGAACGWVGLSVAGGGALGILRITEREGHNRRSEHLSEKHIGI